MLNKILSETHPQGKKFAIIENEFGEIGIDEELIVGREELGEEKRIESAATVQRMVKVNVAVEERRKEEEYQE